MLGFWIASAGWETFGSVRTRSGAAIARKIRKRMKVPPIRKRGWRQIVRQLKSRRGFGTAASATGAAEGRTAAVSAIFDPRIEKCVQHVDNEVDRHEAEGAQQHDSLHHRIVPPTDAVHREPTDARPEKNRLRNE